MSDLPNIQVVDIRGSGPVALATARRATVEELRRACIACLPPLARRLMPAADVVARQWLNRSASPYSAEVAAIANLVGEPGVFMINTSYEWACTAAAHQGSGPGPILLRTLDWPFAGLGRTLTAARQSGRAGDFWNLTWPGAVGVLTGLAPGRFAATINQAPLYRRTRGDVLRLFDYAANAIQTLARVRFAPPAHVLRQVFETAGDYRTAVDMLARTPMARPVLIALAGRTRAETCVIERTETDARVIEGPFVMANDWLEPRPGWESRSLAFGSRASNNSKDRRSSLGARLDTISQPFDWLEPPVLNWATRVGVEMSVVEGTLRAIGFEPVGGNLPARRATSMLDLASQPIAV